MSSGNVVRRRGIVEGGPFSCSLHGDNNDFVTEDEEVWIEHLNEHKKNKETLHYGAQPCVVCGNPVVLDGYPSHLAVIHPECHEELTAGLQQSKERGVPE